MSQIRLRRAEPLEMAKKGIKAKDLAHELGITSRQLIDPCRAEGVPIQNSITKLDRQTEVKVRGWFSKSNAQPRDPA